MFGFVTGKVIGKLDDSCQVVVSVHNLGLEVSVSKALYESLKTEQCVSLWLHTHVREDAILLFGFSDPAEKMFFKLLLGVGGLGPKTALSLLSEHGAEKLVGLIRTKGTTEITTAPGVGKKLAERLVLELSGKLEKWAGTNKLSLTSDMRTREAVDTQRRLRDDLSSALQNLGFLSHQIKATLEKLLENDGPKDFESCFRFALREMSGRHRQAADQ